MGNFEIEEGHNLMCSKKFGLDTMLYKNCGREETEAETSLKTWP